MPNVAGREFAYTPQGMAAAEQYKQSLGMRGGGMMGFRPVGYQGGGGVVETKYASGPRGYKMAVDDLTGKMQKGDNREVVDFVRQNLRFLEEIAHSNVPGSRMVRNVLIQFGTPFTDPVPDEGYPPTQLENLQQERQERESRFLPQTWFERLTGGRTVRPEVLAEEEAFAKQELEDEQYRPLLEGAGMPPISDTDLQNLQRIIGSGVTESPGFEEETFDYFPPERRARGGYVGRGTSAGELAPRGSMSVREAGETLYELAKRRRGMRGGGIMSLRR